MKLLKQIHWNKVQQSILGCLNPVGLVIFDDLFIFFSESSKAGYYCSIFVPNFRWTGIFEPSREWWVVTIIPICRKQPLPSVTCPLDRVCHLHKSWPAGISGQSGATSAQLKKQRIKSNQIALFFSELK